MGKVKRTERGWAGHFICADLCLFRRNTLLECGDTRIIVSTVGNMINDHGDVVEIGVKRYFETMAFHAELADGKYWDADITREVSFDSPWALSEFGDDNKANDMHETVVAEITSRLEKGEKFE
ncbi:MAG TPA: hypothetical protein P5140_08535 [Methanofastidiosum sp.]|nr:hypothetical protein [Methanofastidiosum sp.]